MTLAQRAEELTISGGGDSKRVIGEFVLEEKSRLCEFTTQQITEETCTSKAALVRFAKAMGFSGWREFASKQHYQETHYSDADPNLPFQENSSAKDIISLMCSLQMESLMDTADLTKPWTVDKVVDLLERSGRIALFGMSPNSLRHRHLLLRQCPGPGPPDGPPLSGAKPRPGDAASVPGSAQRTTSRSKMGGLSGAATAPTVWRASAAARWRPLSTAKRASGSPDIISKENERCRQLWKPCLISST